jgi:RNA polymerase sigma factor (sigma-70 family)
MSSNATTREVELAELRPRLMRLFSARRMGHEGLASETMLRVLTAMRRGDAIRDLGAFATGVARRVLLEHLRRRDENVIPLEPVTEWLAAPAPATSREDMSEEWSSYLARLRLCLGRLSPEDRELVRAYYAEGKNKTNRVVLVVKLGISPNALKIRAHRLREKLRVCVTGVEEEEAPPVARVVLETFSPGSPLPRSRS